MFMDKISEYNDLILKKLSVFLNCEPDFINVEIIDELCGECGLDEESACRYVLASAIGLDIEKNERDREIFELYFPHMIHRLNTNDYSSDPYYSSVKLPELVYHGWEFRYESYKPYEIFACNDLLKLPDGRILPQLGFFTREFRYPAALENGREWMLITPNEINTMAAPVRRGGGRVLTFGLGLGYFAFMVGRKPETAEVTVVERDKNVIELFCNFILPQFDFADKLKIINADAYEYAATEMTNGRYDFVFADIWHDPSDGVTSYRKLKKYEHQLPNAKFMYWIEPTLRIYM